ncbi:MAG: hypothetical protein HOP03_17065 [Lysobacter sp.]|nr:hypothetical protein [Lysobacter sp.]
MPLTGPLIRNAKPAEKAQRYSMATACIWRFARRGDVVACQCGFDRRKNRISPGNDCDSAS